MHFEPVDRRLQRQMRPARFDEIGGLLHAAIRDIAGQRPGMVSRTKHSADV